MRLALFGSGSPQSRLALTALAGAHEVAVVVVPAPPPIRRPADLLRRRARERALRPFRAEARALGIPVLRYGPGSRAAARDGLRSAAADILVIASFPHLLGDDVLGLAPRGALNVHMSLLPRHRGPDPLFWTYFADDRETGVTVHRASAQADAGDILAQGASPLERAAPAARTYERLSRLGSELLLAALEEEARGRSRPRPQPAAVAEPRPRPGRPAIEPATLPAERVHHVLAGLGAAYPWLLRDARGGVLAHGPALAYDAAPRRPGLVEALEGRLVVHCADGTVTVARAPLAVRLRWAVRQTFRLTARAGVP